MARLYKGIEIPDNDDLRVEAVGAYEILETPPEREYDDITHMAAAITGCPIAYISIFDATRSWLKSSYGLPPNRPPRPREQSMCAPTICQQEMMVIDDLRQNPRYATLPAVVNPPHARFYCGVPLINRDAYALGTLCVCSPEAVTLSDAQIDGMKRLARLTLDALEGRRDLLEFKAQHAGTKAQLARSRAVIDRAEALVHRLLPQNAATRLLAQSDVAARRYDDIAVICIRLPVLDLERATVLTALVSELDAVAVGLKLERIGLSMGAYFAFAGARDQSAPSDADVSIAAEHLVQTAQETLEKLGADNSAANEVKSGVANGSLLALLVGDDRLNFTFCGQPMLDAYHAAEHG